MEVLSWDLHKKIAELAGVSVGTVDRALHNRGRVDPKVAEWIRPIARELSYRPNTIVKSLNFCPDWPQDKGGKSMNIQSLDTTNYRENVNSYIRYLWGGPTVVTLGNLYDTSNLPGFAAVGDGALLGAILYRLDNDECEISALFSLVQGIGAGTKLLDAVIGTAKKNGVRRVWLITTNDDTQAMRFYQKYGFKLKAVHIGAFEVTRKLKNGLPSLGNDNIPIEHEFEFELFL